jgi:hypothetical protein
MQRVISVIVFFASLWAMPAFGFDQSHADWGAVLKSNMASDGYVRYSELKRESANRKDHPFTRYIESIQGVTRAEFDRWTVNEQKAYLINAYNGLTVKLIVDSYPVKSIRDIGGLFKKPWDVEFFKLLGGAATSLDPIEHKLLRPVYRDVRLHSAVNCASTSCPPLRAEPYVGNRLDEQLDDQMRRWLGDPTRNQYEPSTGTLKLSKIFDWYKSDFDDWGGGVLKVVEKFGPDTARAAIKKGGHVEYLDYDWGLNEAK